MSGSGSSATLGALTQSAALPERGASVVRLSLPSGRLPGVALLAKGPRSYTGEDTVEFECPGHPDLVDEVERTFVMTAQSLGFPARRAAPGEFTLRAFSRGKLDLSQAEGIAATIAATTTAQLRAARHLADGGLGRFVTELADCVATNLALVEAGIDFTDQEDVVAIPPATLAANLQAMRATLEARLAKSVPWEAVDAIPRVVLLGAPNAGKSTLFNALVGKRRAVESPTAGTTRDALEERITLRTTLASIDICIVDVAGLDEARNGLNQAMQARVADAIKRAELILFCVPIDAPAPARPGVQQPTLVVRTMADKGPQGKSAGQASELRVSAHSGAGLNELRHAVAHALTARLVSGAGEVAVLSQRHEELLRNALTSLDEAIATVTARQLRDPELVASSLRAALDALGAISGAIAPDDVLGRIFSTFCVGK